MFVERELFKYGSLAFKIMQLEDMTTFVILNVCSRSDCLIYFLTVLCSLNIMNKPYNDMEIHYYT